jgi:hypothetical protein
VTPKAWIALFITGLALPLSSCARTVDPLNRPEDNRSKTTPGSTLAVRPNANLSDEALVGNAVSTADLGVLAGSAVPWANTATGSAGIVEAIREDSVQGRTCRAFRTTRHSYDGIAVFAGRTCTTEGGNWVLTAFDKQD